MVRTAPYTDWTTGFFPGSLWYGYELTGNKELLASAARFTLALDSVRYITKTHDRVLCSIVLMEMLGALLRISPIYLF
ncbi:hypothetical protein KRR40_38185 [Niabella defluvii]|nr:hypothetical protein KRR40_38185 [Niabella sp. I65]